jgi:hypothetical protein
MLGKSEPTLAYIPINYSERLSSGKMPTTLHIIAVCSCASVCFYAATI